MSTKMEKNGMQHVFDTVKLPHCGDSQSEAPKSEASVSLWWLAMSIIRPHPDLLNQKLCGGTQQSKV